MDTLFADYETYYDKEYSLKKMTPVEYILDPRFEAIGCAFKWGLDGKPFWVDGPELQSFFNAIPDPNVTCMVTHNALFDMCITAWRYNFVPRLMVDTLGVSRAVLGHILRRHSLESVAEHLGLGAKGRTIHQVIGMNAEAIKQAGLWDAYVRYGLNDVELCAGIYDKLVRQGGFPASELAIMDMVIRGAVLPQFELNTELLHEHLSEVQLQKNTLLTQALLLGAESKADLMSNEKFAKLLNDVGGVCPPMKISKITGKVTYAFAKSDPEFLALQEHEDPVVQVLVNARLGNKSTLEETRTQRFINIANLDWPGRGQARLMPIPLRYGAAHTGRLGGDWKLNTQNLRRGGKLRKAVLAPAGHKVITVDSSQVEARMVVWSCGQWDVVEQFARGEDTYAALASKIFDFPVNKKDHPDQRFVGKQGRLGLGYGLGWEGFQRRIRTDSKNQTGKEIILSDEEAQKVVNVYRGSDKEVVRSWRLLNNMGMQALVWGIPFDFAMCAFEKGAIRLPNGMKLHYPDLEQVDGQWVFTYAGNPEKIYGCKLLENMMQALARIATLDAALRIQRRLKCRLAQQAHDENAFVVPDEQVEEAKAVCLEEMRRRPWWAPDLPLDAEVGVGQSYGDAK